MTTLSYEQQQVSPKHLHYHLSNNIVTYTPTLLTEQQKYHFDDNITN